MNKMIVIIYCIISCLNTYGLNNVDTNKGTSTNDTIVFCYKEGFLDLNGTGVDYCIAVYRQNNGFFFDRYCDYYDLLKKHCTYDSSLIASLAQNENNEWSSTYYKDKERNLINYYKDWKNHVPVNIHVGISHKQYDSVVCIIEYIKHLALITPPKKDGIDDIIICTGGPNEYVVMQKKDTITHIDYSNKININKDISSILHISPKCSICYKMHREKHPMQYQRSPKNKRKFRSKRKIFY